MGQHFRTKEQIQKLIAQYRLRRKQLRDKHGFNLIGRQPNPAYIKAGASITRSISRWNHSLRRILERERMMREVSDALYEYFHVRVEGSMPVRNYPYPITRKIFAKYCLENLRVGNIYISRFVNSKDSQWANSTRKAFTQSFSNNIKDKKLYHHAKRFIDEYRHP